MGIRESVEYRMVEAFYGGGRAKRSQVPLMNHVVEGLCLLASLGGTDAAMRAWCVHPMVQRCDLLAENWREVCESCAPEIVLLTMEYRNIANQYLSRRSIASLDEIALSPLSEVNKMLVADKVQNYKDFVLYHQGRHPRSDELTQYFENWMARLGVPRHERNFLVSTIS